MSDKMTRDELFVLFFAMILAVSSILMMAYVSEEFTHVETVKTDEVINDDGNVIGHVKGDIVIYDDGFGAYMVGSWLVLVGAIFLPIVYKHKKYGGKK